jgi:hypothetical protein
MNPALLLTLEQRRARWLANREADYQEAARLWRRSQRPKVWASLLDHYAYLAVQMREAGQ